MATFLDGPAKKVRLILRRLPYVLRVVHDTKTWEWDALDQLDDTPKESELIFVYRRVSKPARGFLCSRGQGCRMFADADYRLHSEQPSDETLRDTQAWRAWALNVDEESDGSLQTTD